jgi:hypothetical protein
MAAAAAGAGIAAHETSPGEVYGEESWREGELSAGELEADAPELEDMESDADLDQPEIGGGDADEEGEW